MSNGQTDNCSEGQTNIQTKALTLIGRTGIYTFNGLVYKRTDEQTGDTQHSYLHLGSEDNGEEWEDDTDNESVVYV